LKPRASILTSLLSTLFAVCLLCTNCAGDDDELQLAQNQDRNRQLRQNMRTVQIAAERYAADRDGVRYPKEIDSDLKTYFPGGIDGKRASPVGPVNPFSGVNEFPVLGSQSDLDVVRTGRKASLGPGTIKYIPLEGGASYAIIGAAHNGKLLMDEHNPDQILVLSNR